MCTKNQAYLWFMLMIEVISVNPKTDDSLSMAGGLGMIGVGFLSAVSGRRWEFHSLAVDHLDVFLCHFGEQDRVTGRK